MSDFNLYDYFFEVVQYGMTQHEIDEARKAEQDDRQAELDARNPH